MVVLEVVWLGDDDQDLFEFGRCLVCLVLPLLSWAERQTAHFCLDIEKQLLYLYMMLPLFLYQERHKVPHCAHRTTGTLLAKSRFPSTDL